MLHADHVGSLLRPQEVLDAWDAHAAGRIAADELDRIEDQAILRALEMQRDAGLQIFSDGEYRRAWFSSAMQSAVDGIVEDPIRASTIARSGTAITHRRPWRRPTSTASASTRRSAECGRESG
jgi:5-methyltetrahydropteroyltriglutamate--homocysteine methyltransferase